jgi:hypothetical protein
VVIYVKKYEEYFGCYKNYASDIFLNNWPLINENNKILPELTIAIISNSTPTNMLSNI